MLFKFRRMSRSNWTSSSRSATRILLAIAAASFTAMAFLLPFAPVPVRTVSALADPCGTAPGNLIVNGSMAGNAGDAVATGWTAFVLEGAPTFEHVTNEQIDPNGSQYLWADAAPFDAGIYQTVTGLVPGTYYRFWLGYALAAYDPGDTVNHRGNWIGRQVGVDATGGTNPRAATVVWSNLVYNGQAAVNIPALNMTFAAQTSKATVFLRAINTRAAYRDKAWFDSACMEAPAPQPSPTSTPTQTPEPTPTRSPVFVAPPPGTHVYLPLVSAQYCLPAIVATLDVGASPKGVAVDPTGNRVAVSLFESSSVTMVDPARNVTLATWGTRSTGQGNGIGVTGGRVFVALRDTGTVGVLDEFVGTYILNRRVGESPFGVGASNGRVWVANYGSDSVSVVDATSTTVVGTALTSSSPALVAALGDRAFVTEWGTGVAEIDSSGTLKRTITTSGAGSFGLAYNPVLKRLYVSNRTTNQIFALNADNGVPLVVANTLDSPYALAFNPNTNHLYVVYAASNQVDVLDGTTLTWLTRLRAGGQGSDGGDGIAVLNDRVYLSNNADGTLSVIQDACTR